MREIEAQPWVDGPAGTAIDLLFETLSNDDVRKVIEDLYAGKKVRLPETPYHKSKVISLEDLDPENELPSFHKGMNAFPWHRMNNKNPKFKYVDGEYVPVVEGTSPERVACRYASSLRKQVLDSLGSDKPTVFLGGECSDGNEWRKEVIAEFEDNFCFLDPYDKHWDPQDNIYDEIAGMANSDYVVFLRGGKGSAKEKQLLQDVGSMPAFKEFEDIEGLKRFLRGRSGRKVGAYIGKEAKEGVEYKSSTTQVDLPKDLAEKVIAWGVKNIPDEDLADDGDGSEGREDEIHISLLYGIEDESPSEELKRIIESYPPFEIRLGLVTMFKDSDKHDVVKIDVESAELQKLNLEIREKIPNNNKYPTYAPHVTIAYVKKGKGDRVLGSDPFQGTIFKVTHIVFGSSGSSSGEKVEIPLSGRVSK
jgi:2'-5' RNA ligase